MPWDPTFWIPEFDFEKLIPDLAALLTDFEIDALEFELPGKNKGVVVALANSVTRQHELIHDLFKQHNVEHWIIDGESGGKCCHTWGESIDIEFRAQVLAINQAATAKQRKGR